MPSETIPRKAIQDIKASERVWAFDLVANGWKLRQVAETYESDYAGDLVRIAVEDETIEATPRHPFWVVQGLGLQDRPRPEHVPEVPETSRVPGRWVDAGDLRVGDALLLRAGRLLAIRELSTLRVSQKVYNFHVRELCCYAVGTGEILVHNNSGQGKPPTCPAPKGGPKTPIHTKVAKPEAEATAMADAWKQGQATRPIIDRGSGEVIGEITADGNRVIRYPHTDRGTPQKHWNLEDKTTGENIHVVIE